MTAARKELATPVRPVSRSVALPSACRRASFNAHQPGRHVGGGADRPAPASIVVGQRAENSSIDFSYVGKTSAARLSAPWRGGRPAWAGLLDSPPRISPREYDNESHPLLCGVRRSPALTIAPARRGRTKRGVH